MERRTFLKLAIGALVFPQLPTDLPLDIVVSPGTALVDGRIVEFDSFYSKIWARQIYEEARRKIYLHKPIIGTVIVETV